MRLFKELFKRCDIACNFELIMSIFGFQDYGAVFYVYGGKRRLYERSNLSYPISIIHE